VTLRLRLAVAAGVAVALAVLAVTITAYAGTKSELRGQLDSELTGLVTRAGPPRGGPNGPGIPGQPGGPQFGRGPGSGGEPPGIGDEGLALDRRGAGFGGPAGLITLIHHDGTVYVPPTQSRRIPVDAQMRAIAASGRGRTFSELHLSGTHLRVLVQGIGTDGAIAVALPMTSVDDALSGELLLLLAIAAGGIALAAVLGILVARTALAPIARFTGQAEAIAANPEQREQQRLEVAGSDELARLGRTFNTTLDALGSSIQAQRNLIADASHELRTPIASLRANLQLLREESRLPAEDRAALRQDMIEELDGLTALVADVVELARGSKPQTPPRDIRLDELVEEALARTQRRAPQLAVHAEIEPTVVHGEEERVARGIANLLDNAVKYGGADGTVEVCLHDGTLTVRDHGPGFHDEDLPFVFDRFHRARDARGKPGSGLGLAIVRQAADAHGGLVRAANAPGGGALLTVSFGAPVHSPRAPAGAAAANVPSVPAG
jgi:two-component system, OmpR family, sensor histidine kinase MprB